MAICIRWKADDLNILWSCGQWWSAIIWVPEALVFSPLRFTWSSVLGLTCLVCWQQVRCYCVNSSELSICCLFWCGKCGINFLCRIVVLAIPLSFQAPQGNFSTSVWYWFWLCVMNYLQQSMVGTKVCCFVQVVDSMVVERARGESQGAAGSLQSLCWGSSATGGIVSAYFSGSLVETYGTR